MDIEGVRGDTEYYDLRAMRSGDPVDLTGAAVKLWFTAKRTKDDLDADALISLNSTDEPAQCVFVDRPDGRFYIHLMPNDTVAIEEDRLVYDVQVREQSGRVTTVQRGTFHLIRDVTRLFA